MTTSMSVAPLAKASGWHFGGVSRNLNVSFLRPVPNGMQVRVVCEVANLGKNLGMYYLVDTCMSDVQQQPLLRRCRQKTGSSFVLPNTIRSGWTLLQGRIKCEVSSTSG